MTPVWSEYLHHVTVHFPIVATIGLAGIGLLWLSRPTDELALLLRWGGWTTFALTTIAVVSGIVTADGLFGGQGSTALRHHRDLGLTTWCVVGLAAWGFERGLRDDSDDWRRFAAALWCVAALSAVGTGHWGGSTLHDEAVPWIEQPPAEQSAPETPPSSPPK